MQRAPFNLLVVAQAGRLGYEAVLLAASLRAADPDFPGRLIVAEPRPTGAWAGHDTELAGDTRAALERLEARIAPFEATRFGATYPHGNKIEALAVLPPEEPFLFLDTDTLVTGPLSRVPVAAARPSASMRRTGTWPTPPLYGPGRAEIWASLYDRFGLDFAASQDPAWPAGAWQRYLYFNAGWFCGPDPAAFHARFLEIALTIRDDPPEALAAQSLDPWLDQIALPLTIHALGGGRPGPELDGLDGWATCHWRVMALLFARESDAVIAHLRDTAAPNRIRKVLREHAPFRKFIYQQKGDRVRALIAREGLPPSEAALRRRLKGAGHWMR